MDKSYYIYDFKKNVKLPDGTKYLDSVIYRDLFHIDYFKNNQWKPIYGRIVTYSNYSVLSIIKNKIKNIKNIVRKDHFYSLIKEHDFCLPYINFDISSQNFKHNIEKFLSKHSKNSLWFLKKSAEVSYGGYDVFPIIYDQNVINNIDTFVQESNKYKKYESNNFTLQRGIRNPILLDGYKFDMRTYGLVVFCENQCEFYYYKKGLLRKTRTLYDKNNIDRSNMLTNTTFHTQGVENTEYVSLTEIFEDCESDSYLDCINNNKKMFFSDSKSITRKDFYNKYFPKSAQIWKNIALTIKNNFDLSDKYGYHLLGLDLIVDSKTEEMFVLEINSSPAIYYPDNPKLKGLHKNMEYDMFKYYFDITINAIRDKKLIKHDLGNWQWIN